MATNYLRRFAAWATDSWEKFKHNLLRAVFASDILESQKLFISNVAHELRTPISIIKTSSEVALLNDDLDPDTRRVFIEIVEELNRASEILNNLLSLNTLARPERITFTNIDLGPLVEEVVLRHRPLAKERGIKLIVRREPGSIVWGNRTALEQVMVNLVKNALSYTPAQAQGKVTVTLRPTEDNTVLFMVADTGIGMSRQDLLHVFDPFYRVDTSRVRTIARSGAGLGLTIASDMVRVHHGRIDVQSSKRKGTVVSVLLPRGGSSAVQRQESTLATRGGT